MRKLISSIIFIAAIVFLAGLAYLAFPREGSSPSFASPAQAEDAPSATLSWNTLAVPLEVGSITADGVAAYIESFCSPACPGAVKQVAKFDRVSQTWVNRTVGGIFPADFNVSTGDALFFSVDSTINVTSFTWAGDVPVQCPNVGCVQYTDLNTNGWNFIMLPLDKSSVATADALGADIDPNVTKVARWDQVSQTWVIRTVGGIFPADFTTNIGYPYFIFADGISSSTWPNIWP